MGLRYLGLIAPAAVNYGFLLLNDGRPHWAALTASLVVLAACVTGLIARGDRRGAVAVFALYFPLNAWPIVLNIIGPLGD